MSKFDLYQTVTDQIVAMLEKCIVPWRHPVLGRGEWGWPKNLISGKKYRGYIERKVSTPRRFRLKSRVGIAAKNR